MTKPCLLILIFFSTTLSIIFLLGLRMPSLNEDGVEIVEVELAERFAGYLKRYNRSYGNTEYLRRQKYFKESLKEIARLNALHSSNVFGITKFSDMSPEEFRNRMTGGVAVRGCQELRRKTCPPTFIVGRNNASEDFKSEDDIPISFDWRKEKVIGPVLDQKYCLGCWAFSIVGVVETMWAIAGHGLHALSIQELIDCSTYNNGCHGGDVRHHR